MKSRRSGLSLILAGLLCGAYFGATDPAVATKLSSPLVRRGWVAPSGENLIDAVNQGRIGTEVGIAGSAVVLLIGAYLLTRRAM